jgi:hypothetical protein
MSTLPPDEFPSDPNNSPLELESVPTDASPPPRPPRQSLGKLSHSARGTQIKSARTILIVIGVLTALLNAGQLGLAPGLVHKAVQEQVASQEAAGVALDDEAVQQYEQTVLRVTFLILGAAVALGLLFIVFGVFVERAPVPITIASLVIYIGATAVYGMLDPSTLVQGLIIKVFFILGLFKAIQAALATERERRADLAANQV